jgi:hypothetical protein
MTEDQIDKNPFVPLPGVRGIYADRLRRRPTEEQPLFIHPLLRETIAVFNVQFRERKGTGDHLTRSIC